MEIPIFPLPNVIFFPHTLLPLHIFEPRYRQMLADCLAGERRLAVVLLKPGWEADYYGCPPVCSVAGAGEIVASEGLPDGRSNILLKGLGRIMIEGEIASPKPYRIARASWLQDVYRSGGEGDLASGVDRLRRLCGDLLGALPEPVPALLEILTQRDAPGVFVDRVSSLVVREPEERQRLLELTDVQQRITEAIAVLEALLGWVKQGSPRGRARWN
ncbi:MAG: LON peptidase substrate-binding domain-containing protein [Candidatus Methylomirabilales bacterium]